MKEGALKRDLFEKLSWHDLEQWAGSRVLSREGEEDDQDWARYQAARRWVIAVNNWGRLGGWDFLICRDPALIPRQIVQITAIKKSICE